MSYNFELTMKRQIIVTNQNIFLTPIKHPSNTLSEHVISYVIKGGWKLKIGNEIVNARADSVFIQPRCTSRIGLEYCPPETHTMFVHFTGAPTDGFVNAESPPSQNGKVCINTLTDARGNPEIKATLKRIIEEQTKGNHKKALSYLNVLLCELSEASIHDRSKYSLGENIKKLLVDPARSFSNNDIAAALGVGVRTAEAAFKTCFGTTIHQYQLARKIDHAKFCLEYYPEMKIIDLALSLGFYDEFHFSRQFKRAVGVSPTEYRSRAKNKITEYRSD